MNKKIIPIGVLCASMFFGTAVSADIQFKLNTDTENTENTNSDSTVGIKLGDGFSFEVIDAKNTMYYKIKNNMTDEITEKNYSLSAGQYFEVKIEYVELTQDEFNEKINQYKENLNKYFNEGKSLEEEIMKVLGELEYEG